ncbi:hypothetical protein LXA43DRAFT_989085 [Ganoderma leucocontextum]|nr:hypothetical protein LXA43DRAFT_989085 [Ganoderma leucocontextum]
MLLQCNSATGQMASLIWILLIVSAYVQIDHGPDRDLQSGADRSDSSQPTERITAKAAHAIRKRRQTKTSVFSTF